MKILHANCRSVLRWLATSLALLSLCEAVIAEPYVAVSKGMHCSSCHSNPAGGGKRNVYGNVFAQAELPAQRIGDPTAKLWTGEVFTWLSVGGNLRAGYESVEVPNASSDAKFDLNRGTVYLDPNDSISEDHQVRWSVLWEYTPIQFLQGRFGARIYDGIPQVDFQNRNEFFAEFHGFF